MFNFDNIKKEIIDDIPSFSSNMIHINKISTIKQEQDDISEYTSAVNAVKSPVENQCIQIKNAIRRKNSTPLSNFPQIKKICILNPDMKMKEKRDEKVIKVGSTNPRSVLKNNLVFSLSVKKEEVKEEEPKWMKRIQ